MCQEAGIELLLHPFVVDSLVEQQRLTGVVIANKSGLGAIHAGVTVDCSADGDMAARAGVPYGIGRAEDGLMQPITLFFRVATVDDETVCRHVAAHPEDYHPFAAIIREARERGEFTIPRLGIGLYRTLTPGVWRINTTRLHNLNGTSAADLTTGEIEGRRQMQELLTFFRKWLPGFANATLLDTAATVGVRETRRITGEYQLTLEDLETGRAFDDVIALAGYPFDIHSPTDNTGTIDKYHTANVYQIPYRSLVPLGIDQLLVTGRSISATHEAMAAIRVMPPAFSMGEAAGPAAAIAVEHRIPPRQVDVPLLQQALARRGAYLGERMLPQI